MTSADAGVSPQTTLAIILGANEFQRSPNLESTPAFGRSANDFMLYLLDTEGFGLPVANLLNLFDSPKPPSEILEEISAFLISRQQEMKEVFGVRDLIVYYTGHGGFTPTKEYFLAVSVTRHKLEGGTSLRMSDFAATIKEAARNLRRYIILDCCFSAAAFKEFQSAPLSAVHVQTMESFPKEGTTLLCSSSSRTVSIAPDGAKHTMFSGALLDVLRKGVPMIESSLSMEQVGAHIKERIKDLYPDEAVRPEVLSPDQRVEDIALVPVFPNVFMRQKSVKDETNHLARGLRATKADFGNQWEQRLYDTGNMGDISDRLKNALKNADNFLCLSDVFGFSLYQLGEELVDAFEDDGYIPYVIGERDRYRSSALSTCLLYLWKAGLIPPDITEIIRARLFDIRDKMPPNDTRQPRIKNKDDFAAWCVSEGASVWSTSMAIIALIESRTEPNLTQDEMLAVSTLWLVRQQCKKTGGWSFQKNQNSVPTIPMTALAIRALSNATTLPSVTAKMRSQINASLTSGYNYLRNNMIYKGTEAYWNFDDQPSLTATVWALQAFECDHRGNNHDLPIKVILNTALAMIPTSNAEWKSECFVKEPVTKYSHQKNFFTFMPSLISPLLAYGISPLEPKIVSVVKQLMNTGQDHWRIKEYHLSPCTFTHAMALNTLVNWCVLMQKAMAVGFFPIKHAGEDPPQCPIYYHDSSRCYASGQLRIRTILIVTLLLLILVLCLCIPSVKLSLIFMTKLLNSGWGIAIFGGVPASLIAAYIYQRIQAKKK